MKFKDKKVKKYRGSKTHGGGAMKKRRGAGNRGGRGMAGSGKRGDAKKPSIQNDKKYFGKHGFKNPNPKTSKKSKSINIQDIEEKLPKLLELKKIEKKGNFIFMDLKNMGYDKLLGTGSIKSIFEINVNFASKKAVEKVQKLGGKVNILKVKVVRPKKEEKGKTKVIEEPEESPIKEKVKKDKPAEKQKDKTKAFDEDKEESKE